MLRVLNIRTAVPMKKPLEALVAKKLRCSRSDISRLIIVRRSIDARRKPRIYFVFTVDVEFVDESRVWKRCRDNKDVRQLAESPAPDIRPGTQPLTHRPIVIGTGPSGLAAAWPWPNTAMRLSSLNGAVTSIPARKTLKIFGAAGPSRHRQTSSSAKAERGPFPMGN